MTILVTGGAGYIGSHTVLEILKGGHKAIIIDDFSNSSPSVISRLEEISGKKIKYYNTDVADKKTLDWIFCENKIDAVIHFAGFKAVGESVLEPLKYYRNNLLTTINLCEIMKKYDVKTLVFSSSATVYAPSEIMPLKEDFALGAVNPYGKTKEMIEYILNDLYISDNDWSIALLRYFNPIGAHESGMIGESPNGIPNNLMPYITQVSIGKLEYLSVYGDDYDTVDGTGVRDYIHVCDLASGHIAALKHCLKNKGIDSFNLGTGKGSSVLEIVAAFEKASGKKINYKITDRRAGDLPIVYADTEKAEKKLGFKSKYDIDRMCVDSNRWQTLNPNGYNNDKI